MNNSTTTRLPLLGIERAGRTTHKATSKRQVQGTLALHDGKAHLLSIGQTGSGKTNLLIANLLTWQGCAVVVDVRGDAMRATARWRRDTLGQRVFCVDPFASGGSPHQLDPLAVMYLPDTEADAEAQTIASILSSPSRSERDPYWHLAGASLIGGVCHYFMSSKTDRRLWSMNEVTNLIFGGDLDDALIRLLRNEQVPAESFARQSIKAYLDLPDHHGSTRSCVRSAARMMLEPFRSRAVQSALGPTSVDLYSILHGRPFTLYLVLPIERLISHNMVLGMWVNLICQTLLRRQRLPDLPTMMFIDECAQLTCISDMVNLVATYMRGQGVKLWSFFQDFAQVKTMFGSRYPTFVNNHSAITFLPSTGMAARELAATFGVSEKQIDDLVDDEQVVYEVGRGSRVVKMVRYWQNDLFKDRFDLLPRYSAVTAKS